MACHRYLVAAIALAVAGDAGAKELEIRARATVSAAGDPQAVRAGAEREARRSATITAIEKVLGPDATRNPRVASKVDSIAAQIPDERFVERNGRRVGADYEMAVTLVLDDKEFRTLLSDAGVAVNTATTRAFAVLAIMDEFLTTPRDLRAPLEELEEYRVEKGKSFSDRSTSASSSRAAAASAATSAWAADARSASSAKASGSHDVRLDAKGKDSIALRNGDQTQLDRAQQVSASGSDRGEFAQQGASSSSLQVAGASSSATARSASASARSAANVASEDHDNTYYKKLVRYQPQGAAPEKTSRTYNALLGQLQDYDLRVLDNDLFRSKYFKDKPITLEQLQNGEQLARYVAFAKSEANADFFMVGTSIIVDAGVNQSTGDYECTGIASVKTWSTVDAESIASETISEASSGRNVDDCSGNLAKKMAGVGGSVLGARIQDYWKRRSTYGREYVVSLTGASLPLMVRAAFTKALKSAPGVDGDVQRVSTDKLVQVVVTYKGSDPLDQAVAMSLAGNPAFATLDARTEGNQIRLCMGPCAESGAAPGEKK